MKQINNLKEILPIIDTVYIHEDNYGWLVKNLDIDKNKITNYYSSMFLGGITIRTSRQIPKWAKKWKFPITPFVEYSKEDEFWARKVNFGYEVDDVGNPAIFVINTMYFDNYFSTQFSKISKAWLYQ